MRTLLLLAALTVAVSGCDKHKTKCVGAMVGRYQLATVPGLTVMDTCTGTVYQVLEKDGKRSVTTLTPVADAHEKRH